MILPVCDVLYLGQRCPISQSKMSYIIVGDIPYLRVGYASPDKGGDRPCRGMLFGEAYGSISRGAVTGSMSAMLKGVV